MVELYLTEETQAFMSDCFVGEMSQIGSSVVAYLLNVEMTVYHPQQALLSAKRTDRPKRPAWSSEAVCVPLCL